ncbi:MAG: penicillin-binding protein activator [Bdellovibrionales bacterium]
MLCLTLRISDRAQKIVEQIDARRKVSPRTIGVVLPLSGRHSEVAYRTLQGLQLGLGIYGNDRSNFKLAVIDSETNPDQARRATERLVIEDHVIAVVGSLLSRTAVAVASKADELNVPNITLSQKSGLTEIGTNVFRSALTSKMQVQELVRTAMDEKGMKRFAVLYPNDRYGVEFTNLFWDEVKARGGEIVAAQMYPPKSTDFSGPIKRLVGTFYIDDRRDEYQRVLRKWYSKQKYINSRISPPNDILPPIIDFDAIFIPDNVRAVGQIAPALAYHDVNKVTLLGTNLWNSPALIDRAQQYVQNTIFVDGVLLTDEEFQKSKFYRDFYSTFNSYPTIFEAQAYDVGLLLRQLILSGEQTRGDLQAALQKVKGFQGSLGEISMQADRELSRNLVRLSVQDDKIMRLERKKAAMNPDSKAPNKLTQ